MRTALQQVKHAIRVVSRDRTYAATTILTLGLCIGAHAAIFTIVNAVLLRPLPVPEPDRLMWIANSYPKAGVVEADNGVPDYYDRKASVPAFEEIAMFTRVGRTIGTRDGVERIQGMLVTPSLFRTLRAGTLRGRVLEEQDAELGEHQKVLLSYALWQQILPGDANPVGRELRINGVPHAVIGVMPPTFQFVEPAVKFWLPLAFSAADRADSNRHNNNYLMIGRLAPGATRDDAQRQIDALNVANLDKIPELREALLNAGFRTDVMPLQQRLVRDVHGTLFLLWGGVGFVLLIGCVNVTNLTLVRATARAREFATRQALGASRGQLMRQLLAEGLVVAGAAGVLGVILGQWAVAAITAAVADRIPRGSEIALDTGTVAATAAVTVTVAALIALLPLAHLSRAPLAQAVREEGRTGTAGRRARLVRRGLVTAQVGFAFMLLIGGGLLLASFREVLRVNPGFDAEGVLTGVINLPSSSYPEDTDLRAFMERAHARIRALPGVREAGLATAMPFGDSYSDSVILPEGHQPTPGESVVSPARNVVTPGYFEALRIPLKRGRLFDARDTADSLAVAIVDERLARRFWPDSDPVGRRMYLPSTPAEVAGPTKDTRWLTVVGVVGDVKQRGLVSPDERLGAYYFPYAQVPNRGMSLVVHAAGDPLSLAPAVRRELAAMDPELPFFDVHTMSARMERSVTGRRVAMVLAVTFAGIALLLATVGIYGVLAYQVTQRTREIGIRMALGSNASGVFSLILREGVVLLALGVGVGLAGAVAMRRILQEQLFGVSALEPTILLAVAVILSAVALAASALPARRAARIDPVVALTE